LGASTPALAQPSSQFAQAQVKQAATTEVSPQELEQFAQAIEEMRSIQLESRDKVSQALQEEGISKERFQEILKAQRNPEVNVNASQQEMQKFESASQKLADIQRNTQSQMKNAVQEQGLEVPRFQQILAAVREQPTLQQQVQQMIQESQDQEEQG
jgi:hydroxymethylpyrimidine pyrophosphatase-like HAD family hydrolase